VAWTCVARGCAAAMGVRGRAVAQPASHPTRQERGSGSGLRAQGGPGRREAPRHPRFAPTRRAGGMGAAPRWRCVACRGFSLFSARSLPPTLSTNAPRPSRTPCPGRSATRQRPGGGGPVRVLCVGEGRKREREGRRFSEGGGASTAAPPLTLTTPPPPRPRERRLVNAAHPHPLTLAVRTAWWWCSRVSRAVHCTAATAGGVSPDTPAAAAADTAAARTSRATGARRMVVWVCLGVRVTRAGVPRATTKKPGAATDRGV
jgi:hypothetical protein